MFVSLFLVILGIIITYFSVIFSKKGQFYTDTHFLIPLGVFVWGDGLILGPFWIVSGVLFTQFSLLLMLRYVLLFWAIRTGYEVIYWITHQATKHEYQPPLFRNVSWLDTQQSAILYQVLNTVGMFLSLFACMYTFL
jgi:uncharacterized membrane protein